MPARDDRQTTDASHTNDDTATDGGTPDGGTTTPTTESRAAGESRAVNDRRTTTETGTTDAQTTEAQTTGTQTTDAQKTDTQTGDSRPTGDRPADQPTDERTTDRPTGAEAVVRALEAAGVDHLFGVQGGAIMPVYDALYDGAPRHVSMAHEQGAAHAADAYGQVTGEPGVCLATSGPGATNLVTGIADAAMDSDPVVALTGQVPTDLLGKDAFQETDTVGVTEPITTANYLVTDADDADRTVADAFTRAATGRQGPTLVDLPKDVTQATTTTDSPADDRTASTTDGPSVSTGDDRTASTADERSSPTPDDDPTTDDDPIPDDDSTGGEPTQPEKERSVTERAEPTRVVAAARAVETAERPLLLAGGGVVKGDASDELRAFATDHGIPVVTTMPGLGSFPEDHDLSLSWAGMHGTGYANRAISHCDLLIAVGTRFDDRLTGDVSTFAPEAAVIHCDVDPAEISKNVYADYPLIGDAATVLDQLAAETDRSPDTAAWRVQCAAWREEYPMTYAAPPDRPLKPQLVVEAVDEATADDTIVTTGVGQHQMWAAQYWTFTEPRTWISSNGLGTMGYGLPAAIGATVAAPDRTVVSFEGDGSFLMTSQELAVAVREGLDLTVFVLNNEAVGMVRQWQDGFYEGRRMASEYPWVPDFAALAEAYGASGFTLAATDEVADVVTAALATDGPAVVDCHIDPEENVFPMVPSGGANDAFALREDHL